LASGGVPPRSAFASATGKEKQIVTRNKIFDTLLRVAARIWKHGASRVWRERENKADELWFELLKGLV
jgi:hypothetical protein